MTDRSSLLAAVLAHPSDDTPRLVYADYLDDTGAPGDALHAKLIRLQTDLARTPPDNWGNRPKEVSRLLRRLASEFRTQLFDIPWIAPKRLAPAPHSRNHTPLSDRTRWVVERGFLGTVRCRFAHLFGSSVTRPCLKCKGEGLLTFFYGPGATNPYRRVCPLCDRSGIAYPRVSQLVRQCPVTRIDLIDRAPAPRTGDLRGNWTWAAEADLGVDRDTLPDPVYDRLTGGASFEQVMTVRAYHLGADALADASNAIIDYGRALVAEEDARA